MALREELNQRIWKATVSMFVKICGTTNLADAELAVELGADALGFIFAPSKRRVTVEQAAAITARLPARVEKVGVFTEPDARVILDTVLQAGLSAVQLHMPYDPELVERLWVTLGLDVRLWQVVGIEMTPGPEDVLTERWRAAARWPFADPRLAVVLLDAVKNGSSGGLGQAFPWKLAADAFLVQRATVQAVAKRSGLKIPEIVVAGGLLPENVSEAMATLKPWGVDVVSGVEASPGRKSPDRLRAFFEAVRGAV